MMTASHVSLSEIGLFYAQMRSPQLSGDRKRTDRRFAAKRPPRASAPSPHRVMGWRALSILWFATIVGCCRGAAFSDKSIAALAETATTRIEVKYQANASFPALAINAAAVQSEGEYLNANNPGASVDEKRRMLLQAMADAPQSYFASDPNHMESQPVGFAVSGSGFILSSNGFVVTNAHVATTGDSEIQMHFVQIGLQGYIQNHLSELRDQLQGLSEEEQALFNAAVVKYLTQNVTLNDEKKAISVSFNRAVGSRKFSESLPAELIRSGEEAPGKDVAILRMPGENYPTLPLATGDMQVGDRLYAMGFPGPATYHPFLSKESVNDPTFTIGTVSALKTMQGGWEVIQTDANIQHGSSGGPALNDQGEVVGLTTFVSNDDEKRNVSGFNFVVPASIIKEFLGGIHLRPSPCSDIFRQALQRYDDQNYAASLDQFKSMDDSCSKAPSIVEMRDKAQVEYNKHPHFPIAPWMIVVIVGILIFAAYASRHSRSRIPPHQVQPPPQPRQQAPRIQPQPQVQAQVQPQPQVQAQQVQAQQVQAQPQPQVPPQPIGAPIGLQLRQGSRTIALHERERIAVAALPGLIPQGPDPIVAEVTPNPMQPSIFGLKNLTPHPWRATLPTGETRDIPPGRSIKLSAGVIIQADNLQFAIEPVGVSPQARPSPNQRAQPNPTSSGYQLRVSTGRTFPLNVGDTLSPRQLPGITGSASDSVALVEAHPSDPGKVGLSNRSQQEWSVTLPTGDYRLIPPGKTVRLASGIVINFGTVSAEVLNL